MSFFWLFTFAFLPETKNKKPEEMAHYFQNYKNLLVFRKKSQPNNVSTTNGYIPPSLTVENYK